MAEMSDCWPLFQPSTHHFHLCLKLESGQSEPPPAATQASGMSAECLQITAKNFKDEYQGENMGKALDPCKGSRLRSEFHIQVAATRARDVCGFVCLTIS